MSLESIRKDLERGLKVRLKRVSHVTEKGGPTGTQVELDAAQKDVNRATARLERAQIAHEVSTREVQEYAQALRNNGGNPELPEDFAVYTRPTTDDVADDVDPNPMPLPGEPDPVPAADQVDSAGDFTDPDRNGTANLDETDGEPEDQRPRVGGRFARRGQVV